MFAGICGEQGGGALGRGGREEKISKFKGEATLGGGGSSAAELLTRRFCLALLAVHFFHK